MTISTQSSALFPTLDGRLARNAEWAESIQSHTLDYFKDLVKGQQPEILWFGCSDSRVPESPILGGTQPGDVFVHRNIANTFRKADDSCHAVLVYGVGHLGVKHVIVVGHTACGGCAAAHKSQPPNDDHVKPNASPLPTTLMTYEPDTYSLPHQSDSALINFLQPLIELRHSLGAQATLDELIIANVKRGIDEICETKVIKNNWKQAQAQGEAPVYVHGWLFDVSTGLIKDLALSRGP